MTNVGIRAILALPKMPERQLRFLIALETFTCGEDGWREAGTELLAGTAGLSVNTIVKARGELGASGAIEYRRGNGRGQVSTYRRKVPPNVAHLPEPRKVPSDTDHLSGPGKVPSDVAHLSGPGKVPKQAPERYPNSPRKGGKRNAATSGNASGALEPSALEPSALKSSSRRTPRTGSRAGHAATADDDHSSQPLTAIDARTLLLGLDAHGDEIDPIINLIADAAGRDPGEYLLEQIGKHGEERGRRIVQRARRKLGLPEPKPPWCRDPECDERTRLRVTETEDGPKAHKCPRCHPDLPAGGGP